MAWWETWRKKRGGGWRRVKPALAKGPGKRTNKPTAQRIAGKLRAQGIRAGVRKMILPKWRIWLIGDVLIEDDAPAAHKQNWRRLRTALANAAADDHRVWRIASGYRTNAEQEALYRAYLAGTGNLAAKPGQSNHQFGNSADVYVNGKPLWNDAMAAKAARRRNLHASVPGEQWHTSLKGVEG